MGRTIRRRQPSRPARPCREDFATWPEWRTALEAYLEEHADLEEWLESAFVHPESVEDWIAYEVDNLRRWWASPAATPLLNGSPGPVDVARAAERGRALAEQHGL